MPTTEKVDKQRIGAAIRARSLNALRNKQAAQNVRFNETEKALRTRLGIGPKYFKIVTIEDDFLTANPFFPGDESVGTDVVPIGKPWMLQRTPFDTNTITYPNGENLEYTYDATNPERKRVSDDGTFTLVQFMVPMYFVDEIIRASAIWTSLIDSNNAEIVWEDDNTAGRHWAS
jgi:hypothetical protein